MRPEFTMYAAMPKTLHFQHTAMATLFEGWLVGEDLSHLRAVSQVVQEEISRLECLLSRHDPQAELARLNREAGHGLVKVERELFEVLEDCLNWFHKTEGHFDIGICSQVAGYAGLPAHLKLYSASSRVRFTHPALWLDLGGYGKGYALDSLGAILAEFGVENYFLHGGNSSALAKGVNSVGEKWRIGIPNEFQQELPLMPLQVEGGFSYSSIDAQDADILHAPSGTLLSCPLVSVVQAPTALEAEVWSTSFLGMGKEKGSTFARRLSPPIQVEFFEPISYEA